MKRTFTALAALASLAAGGASAFEVNVNRIELRSIGGVRTVNDLSVGVKALVDVWAGCSEGGKLYLEASDELVTDPNPFATYFEIRKQPDGAFKLSFGPDGDGNKDLPNLNSFLKDCGSARGYGETEFSPVTSINGFTDLRSFWIDLLNQGYE
jgi:hypothetical protein